MENKPKDVSEFDFKDFFKYWASEKFKKMSERNTKNRKQLMNPHTAGKTSFAVRRNNLEKEKESPDEVSSKEFFVATRSTKPDRVYKDSNKDTISKIVWILLGYKREDDDKSFDAFTSVMGKEHPGSLRLYGRGVTKTSLKRKALSEPCSTSNDERMEKMEELEERMHQRMLEILEQQKEAIHQEVTNDILGRLKCMYPGLQLNAAHWPHWVLNHHKKICNC